ncbi:PKD domain-containing protein, partial [Algoriphagus formosus]
MTKSTVIFCLCFLIAQLSFAQVTTFLDNGTLTNTAQTAIEFDNASIRVRSTATATIPLRSTGAASITFTLKGGDGGTATWDGLFTDLVAQGGEGGTVTFTMPITSENEGKRITFYLGKHGENESHPIIASGGGGASTAIVDHNGTLLALAGGGGGGSAVETYQSSGRPGGTVTDGHATTCGDSGNAGVNGTTGNNTPESLGAIVARSSDKLSIHAGGGGGLSGISRVNTGIHSESITGKSASDGGWGGYHPEDTFYSGTNCNQDTPFQVEGCIQVRTKDRSRGGTGYSGGGAGSPWLYDPGFSSCSEVLWNSFGAGGGGGGYDGGGGGGKQRGGGGGSSYVDPKFTNTSFREGGYVTNSQNGTVSYQVNYDNQPPVAVCKNTVLVLGQGNYITNDGQIGVASGINGEATLDPAAIDGGSIDDVLLVEMTTSKNTFTCNDLGENTVTLTVTDANGNSGSCSAQVTVVDNFAPTITSATSRIINAPDFGVIDMGFRTSLTITPPELNFVDNCGVASVVQAEPFTVTCSDIGKSFVKEVVATDASGNQNVVYLNYSITSSAINTSKIYVNANQPDDSGDGLSWATAKKYLNSALAMLDGAQCYKGKQIWVAGGNYYPDEGTNQTDNDRLSTFLLGNEIAIYGGFSGDETSLDQRDYANNPTILSGDLQQDDQAGLNNADNAYTVVSSLNTLPFIMDGFIISGGNSNGTTYETSVGGGVAGNSSSSFRNCIFSGNTANLAGGAFFSTNAEVEFINCIFSGNTADTGGAIYSDVSSLSLINSTLSGNSASTDGGAISSPLGSTLAVKNSIIWNNRAQGSTTSVSASISGIASYANSLVANISSSGIVSNADPLFVEGIDFTTEALPTTAGDFHAQLGIVRDAGDKSYNTLEKDLDGQKRILGQIDLGPYEYGYDTDYFVTTWQTTTVNERITLPVVGYNYYRIDWDNDGVFDYTLNSALQTESRAITHTFAEPGIHTIVIYALGINFNFKDSPYKNNLLSIDQWGSSNWRSMRNSFYGCSNLVINAKDAPSLINATDLSYMFAGATSLDYDFSHWNVSTITNMQGMFDGVTLSEENYDKLLNSWSNLGLKRDVIFSAGNSNYCLGEPGRTKLIESFGWEITDGGPSCDTTGCTDDNTPPEPELVTLPDIAAECEVTGLTAPTATDNCATTVTVTHDAVLPIATQGTTVVTWTYDDGNGNTSTQTQNVVIKDLSAPVPDVVTLPEVTAEAPVTELTLPTATDNCTTGVTVTNDAVFPITENTVVTWTYTDAAGNFSTQTQNVVIKKGTAPVVTAPAITGVQEDVVYAMPDAIQVTDEEGDDLILTFTVTGGTLSMGTNGITFGGQGNGSASFTASGTLVNLNSALDAATFISSPNLNGAGAGSISIVANDGHLDSETAFVIFDIDPINDDPQLTGLPASITIEEDDLTGNFDISAATISDVDALSGDLTLLLSASGGVFQAAGLSGILVSGDLTTDLSLTGTLGKLNEYLSVADRIYFRPDANLNGTGAGSVDLKITDNGNRGIGGGSLVELGTVAVNITPINDSPFLTGLPETIQVYEGAADFIDLSDATFGDVDSGSQEVLLTLMVTSGSLSAIGKAGVMVSQNVPNIINIEGTASQIDAFLKDEATIQYTPETGVTGDAVAQLLISADDGGNTGSGSGASSFDPVYIDVLRRPTITAITVPESGTYGLGKNIDFILDFSEAVVVNTTDGTPGLGLNIGGETKTAAYLSGSGTSRMVFRYTVREGDLDQDGIEVNRLSLNGGSIQTNEGVSVDLTLGFVPPTIGVVVDAVAPSGYSVTIDQSPISSINQDVVSFTFDGAEVGTNYTYTFSSSSGAAVITGSGLITAANQQIIGIDLTSLGNGTVTLSVRLTDLAGNVGEAVSDTSNKVSPISASISDQVDVACNGEATGSLTVQVNAGVPNYSYSWSNGAMTTNTSSVTNTVNGLSAGTYTVTITDGNGQKATASATIEESSNLIITPTLTHPSKSAGSDGVVALDVTGGMGPYEFSWVPNLGTTSTISGLTEGTYKCIVTDQNGCSEEVTVQLKDPESCVAQSDFTINPEQSCTSPTTVYFTDNSSSADSWSWDFGDGGTSSAQNPVHTYTSEGNFTVTLTVTDAATGCSSISNKVFSIEEVSADFTASTTFGCGPLTTTFTDTSVGAVSWEWDFGDGSGSTDQNPSHTYQKPGKYTVSLKITGATGCTDTKVINSLIEVLGPDVAFSEDVTDGCGPLTVSFTDNTFDSSPITGWKWDFGDGTTSNQQNPVHTFEKAGTYSVSLTISDFDGCSRTLRKTDLIQVNVLDVEIRSTNVTCNGGSDGSITATLNEGVSPFTYEWNTGAETATVENLTAGSYSVKITDSNGCAVTKSVEVTEPAPAAITTSSPNLISYSSAVLGGEFQNGVDCALESGIVYGTASGPDITDDKVVMALSGSEFSGTVSGLKLNTVYYARAYTTNQNGRTIYGNEITFRTTKKELDVKVATGQSKVYGATDPIFAYTVDGFEGTDNESILTGTLARVSGEEIGMYSITVGTLDAGADYSINFIGADFEITPAEITGITFDDESFVFDGTDKSIVISGTLPAGTSVAYANNTRTDVGTQEATATITGSNFNDLVLTADLTITPADIAGITFDDGIFVFDGTAKSLAISGTLPSGTSVAYTNNSKTNVGTQEVTATITGSNFNEMVLTADLTITPADITGITFERGSFVFDGTDKSIVISGTLPAGTSVSYTNNSRTDVGTQEVTATITGSNYNTLVLTADLTITPADITGVTFDDGSFVFDGTEKSIEISGTLPAGTSVAYANNTRTDVGTQEATATITGSNYNTLVLTADLTITPAAITGITFNDESFVFDGTEKSILISGTLPAGTSVTYASNSRTDVGTQEATATITGSNFNTLVLTADLTITPADITGITFDDGSFVFDGTEKTLVISGTLPAGTSVAYSNNTRTDVGTQEVTATITGSNYTELVLTAGLTITTAELTVTADIGQSKLFGGTDPVLTFTATGYGEGDDETVFTGTLVREQGEAV